MPLNSHSRLELYIYFIQTGGSALSNTYRDLKLIILSIKLRQRYVHRSHKPCLLSLCTVYVRNQLQPSSGITLRWNVLHMHVLQLYFKYLSCMLHVSWTSYATIM